MKTLYYGLIWAIIVIFVLLLVFYLFYVFYFLRDPIRNIPKGNNIVSPADGKVIMIKEFKNNSIDEEVINKPYSGIVKTYTSDVSKEGYMVSIFMNVFDVHYNRAPINGTVKYVEHKGGKFLNAGVLASTFENENVQILFEDKGFKVKTIQIAGLVARRIVPFVEPNQKVIKGEKIGLIKLGSQVTVILPKNVDLQVKVGDVLIAGESILAKR